MKKKHLRRQLEDAEARAKQTAAKLGTQLTVSETDRESIAQHLADAGFVRIEGLRTAADRGRAGRAPDPGPHPQERGRPCSAAAKENTMSDGFAQMLELQTNFVETARAVGIDVEVSSKRDGTVLTTRSGMFADRHNREQAALAAAQDEDTVEQDVARRVLEFLQPVLPLAWAQDCAQAFDVNDLYVGRDVPEQRS